MLNFFASIGQYFYPHLSEISTALVACFLVMCGGEINRLLRKLLREQNFIVRTLIFIIINAFGYGLLIVKVAPYLSNGFRQMPSAYMAMTVIISFIIIGVWAQKNRQI
ncbi:DUF3392 family protein [Vibrio astriarenae]|uniref:DUF3392 family protein n=1 Tax=Vibrio astriarenae TaxID=1481923 RepID=A0A7Z2T5D2_9VIBR|nr:DUF3392 domain-containing protein [Vibrio astriarenae]QIA64723.1 DUF3392 family protein [Vibrio astriarenae]